MTTSTYTRRKSRRKKKRPEGYIPPPSPSRRPTPWVSVSLRAEHYAMLRELGDFYEATLSSLTATLITDQFLKVLDENHPDQAMQLRRDLKDEKHSKHIIDLDF